MTVSSKAVFLSYASQDAEAAQRICDALRAAGVEVWFDQNELVGGDAWDAKIRGQISSCALFMPIISANTQARKEGYFRIEWRLAAQRTHAMADDACFLMPVVIDDTKDAEARVPVEFKAVQWTKLPAGDATPIFCARVKALLSEEPSVKSVARGAAAGTNHQSSVTYNHRLRRFWWALPIFGVTMALVLVLRDKAVPLPAAAPASAPATSEARKLIAQARQVYESSDDINRQSLEFAEELTQRAQVADPTDPEVWETSARLSHAMLWFGIDTTARRREVLLQQAERARSLAPQSLATQLISLKARLAMNYSYASNASDLRQEAEALAARAPDDWQVQDALATIYRFINEPDLALAAMHRAFALSNHHPAAAANLVNILWRQRRYGEARQVLDEALTRQPAGRLQVFDVLAKLRWSGDTAAARAAVGRFPTWLTQEDRGVVVSWQAWMYGRLPREALRAANAGPRDYLRDFAFTGPRTVLTALAHEQAGNTEAARADWQGTLARCEQELATDRDSDSALYWQAWALQRLGRADEARAIAARLQQRNQTGDTGFFKGTYLAPLLAVVGQVDAAIADLNARANRRDDSLGLPRAMLELDPLFDPLRADPRFQELVRKAPAPAATPLAARLALPAPTTEARKLALNAHGIFTDKLQTGDRLRAAMELAERATALDPLDGEVWALSALADLAIFESGFDDSDGHRDQIRAKLAKAKGLAPRADLTRYAEAKAFIRAEGNAEGVAAGVEILRGLPDCSDVQGLLGVALHLQGKYEEGGRLLASVGWDNAAGWAYLQGGNLVAAQAMGERQMGTDPVNGAVMLSCVALARADLAAMHAALERVPLAARLDEEVVGARLWLAIFQRDAGALLRAARTLPAGLKRNGFVHSPRGYFIGLAQHRLGNQETARAEWTMALQQVETRLDGEADDIKSLFNRLFLLAELGRTDEVDRDLKVLRQRIAAEWKLPMAQLLATMGRRDETIAALDELLQPESPNLWFSHADTRFNPVYDFVRGDPRFEKLLRGRRPKFAQPFADERPEAAK